jgi:hypothetical protein
MKDVMFEYKALVYRPDQHPDEDDLAGYMNSLGYNGWRFVGVIQESQDFFAMLIFEREIGPDETRPT